MGLNWVSRASWHHAYIWNIDVYGGRCINAAGFKTRKAAIVETTGVDAEVEDIEINSAIAVPDVVYVNATEMLRIKNMGSEYNNTQ